MHFAEIYKKKFNTDLNSFRKKVEELLSNDIGDIGKLANNEIKSIREDIIFGEKETGMNQQNISAHGRPDGVTSRLLTLIHSKLPYLIHGAI